jgi:hypothetical protein
MDSNAVAECYDSQKLPELWHMNPKPDPAIRLRFNPHWVFDGANAPFNLDVGTFTEYLPAEVPGEAVFDHRFRAVTGFADTRAPYA